MRLLALWLLLFCDSAPEPLQRQEYRGVLAVWTKQGTLHGKHTSVRSRKKRVELDQQQAGRTVLATPATDDQDRRSAVPVDFPCHQPPSGVRDRLQRVGALSGDSQFRCMTVTTAARLLF